MLATGRPTELAKILEPLAMPPEETISSSPMLTVRLLTAPPFSTVIMLRSNAVPPLTMPPDKTL